LFRLWLRPKAALVNPEPAATPAMAINLVIPILTDITVAAAPAVKYGKMS
jgi:hypothetical protein